MKNVSTILFLFFCVDGFCQTPVKCIAPKISMGANQSIVLPTSSTILTATATGQNGHPTVTNYSWALDSGNSNAKVVNPNQNVTQITGLTIAGVYKFNMTCRDSCGAPNTGYCYVTVSPAPPPVTKFIATASFTTVTNGTYILTCSSNVSPFSVWWQKSGGGNIRYSNQASKTCTVSKLQRGTYVINLSADYQGTDPTYKGQNSQAKVTIVVK